MARWSRRQEHPRAQEVDLRAAISLPFDQLQAIDVPLGLPVAVAELNLTRFGGHPMVGGQTSS